MASDGGKLEAERAMDAWAWFGPLMIDPVTRCKHGRGDCDECGTSDRRDAVHATRNGRGRIASLPRRASGEA